MEIILAIVFSLVAMHFGKIHGNMIGKTLTKKSNDEMDNENNMTPQQIEARNRAKQYAENNKELFEQLRTDEEQLEPKNKK